MATEIKVNIASGNDLQAITWPNIDFSFVGFCCIHVTVISQPVDEPLFCIMNLQII